ncbi:hypothetical protein BRE01_67520 [Brevibacillus reuszeri]|uniref:HNH nuclease domain-containing protein n=1 Tax=Brevibacillus reuszeri TaxID=54915 RepID=A0A0K9YPU5_9BACL|nr:hypothetical protein [Brevibacillus reuszeri]KNB70200.1 hypothetical protein ADS79_14620 [Brevibacillus reuszeri]GED73050.1 hypothetical protein BRE01_67520 [Brevibacillus reuszeri]
MRNRFKIEGDTLILYLDKRNGDVLEAYADFEDFERLKAFKYKWSPKWRETTQSHYAQATIYLGMENSKPKYKNMYLHKFVTSTPPEVFLDHVNHNTLDCRKRNLVEVSNKKNLVNRRGANTNSTTGCRNVCWSKTEQKYIVQLQVDGKNKCFGRFDELEDAIQCAEQNRMKLYKEIYCYAT